jgi:hypothetical protein
VKRSEWLGPLIGGVLWITGLTFVIVAPVTGWIGSWPDWLKLTGTLVAAALVAAWLARRARRGQLELEHTRERIEAWESAHPQVAPTGEGEA